MERFLRIALLLCDQATVVDLGTGRYLLALLSGNGEAFACRVFQDRLTDAPTDKARALSKLCDTAPVPLKALPMLVTFGDIADPTSVRQVAPDDLAASFGQGYALREVTLEITDAPVTTGVVEGVLGWLAGLDGGLLDGLRLVRSPLKTGWQMIYLAEVLFATALFRSNSCLFPETCSYPSSQRMPTTVVTNQVSPIT